MAGNGEPAAPVFDAIAARAEVERLMTLIEKEGWTGGYRVLWFGEGAQAELFAKTNVGRFTVAKLTIAPRLTPGDKPLVQLDDKLTFPERATLARALGTAGDVEWWEGGV